MYQDFSIQKLIKMGSLVTVLCVTVFSTISIKNVYVGNGSIFSHMRLLSTNQIASVKQGLAAGVGSTFNAPYIQIHQRSGEEAKSIPVLLYHSVVEGPDEKSVWIKNFEQQMLTLKRAGWQTVTLTDLKLFINGKKKLPDKSFVLTFDDGAEKSYYPVDPVLKALGFKAATFVITKRSIGPESGTTYYLSETELRGMLASGRWEVGSHGREAHGNYSTSSSPGTLRFMSNRLWLPELRRRETQYEFEERIKKDFAESKHDIEQAFGTTVLAYAFPFGDFGQNSDEREYIEPFVSAEVGKHYPLAFYQVWAGKGDSFNYFGQGGHMVKRIEVKPEWSAEELMSVLENAQPKQIPYTSSGFSKGWRTLWGTVEHYDSLLRLSPAASSASAAVFLEGSQEWGDYLFRARVDWERAESISLFVRHRNNKNYSACAFTPTAVSIQNTVNGAANTVIKNKHELHIPRERVWLVAQVDGTTVRCYLGSTLLAEAQVDELAPTGGIGVQVWHPTVGAAQLTLHEVRVADSKDAVEILSLMPSY